MDGPGVRRVQDGAIEVGSVSRSVTDGGPASLLGKRPLPAASASVALGRCLSRTTALLAQRRLHQPSGHVGRCFVFADGTAPVVYRETVLDRQPTEMPAILVVTFRLRFVRGETGHALFRYESELNTMLFAGFPGFVSKLWFRHDEQGRYRGLYEWDDPALARAYVRALWCALAVVSALDSIYYAILPGLRRDELLRDPAIVGPTPVELGRWWRLRDDQTPVG